MTGSPIVKNKADTTIPDVEETDREEVVISIKGLSKKFCKNLRRSMFYGLLDLCKNLFGVKPDNSYLRKDEFWALDNLNFEVKKGENIGIVGMNGSGKSTFLRVLTGIFPPDKGEVSIKGKVASLISLGAGFHPHLTGRENIFLNGAILGMAKEETEHKLQSIIDYSEVGEFIDAPVSTYSSGMVVRLGFAIAIHCEPDILLVDEILSVGDISFINKCMRSMHELHRKAKGLIFVSHNLENVLIICSRVIVLDKGKIIFDGETHKGLAVFQELTRDVRVASLSKEEDKSDSPLSQFSSGDVRLSDMGVLSPSGEKVQEVDLDAPLTLFCDFTVPDHFEYPRFFIGIVNERNTENVIWLVNHDNKEGVFKDLESGSYRVKVFIKSHHLSPGIYIPKVSIKNGKTGEEYERIVLGSSFKVKTDGIALERRRIIHVEEEWSLEKL